ncbi:MAG: hypothetical protein R3190_11950, partial [Thermoanaerobaculia bacterium]|nr:hypothetical protein [Thermoanaerobaculia bacterium]
MKAGGVYRVGADIELEVTSLGRVAVAEISDAEARRAGLSGREELVGMLAGRRGTPARVYRIEFLARTAGERPEVPADELPADELEALVERLRATDRRRRTGPWVADTLRRVADAPRRRAGDLAAAAGRELRPFKADVRKLKGLGLTRSHEIG